LRLIWLPELLTAQVTDTTGGREVSLPPVSIEGERPLRVKRWTLDSTGWATVGNHLSQLLSQTEGVYLRDYGGQGSLKTLSIRGMGAPLTAVSLQGLPLRAPTLGLINLAPFFLPALKEVAFSPGGNLTLSPGAIGFLSLRWHPTENRTRIGWRLARYGEAFIYTHHETPTYLLQVSALSALNRYPFSEPASGLREGAEYRYLQSTWAYRRSGIQITGWGYASQQSIPPPVLVGAPVAPSEALRQHFLSHTGELNLPGGHLLFQHTIEGLTYTDRFGQVSWSRLHTLQAQIAQQKVISPWTGGYTLYGAIDYVESNRMAKGFVSFPRIWQGEGALTAYFQWQRSRAYLRGEGRLTALSRFPLQGSALLRAGWRAFGVEIMRGVRFPSLWERYWVGYGNPTLRPEQSIQLQAFVEKSWKNWQVYGAAFLAQTRHRIITVPLSPVRWQAYSLGYVESYGAEGRLTFQQRGLLLWGAGTLLLAREYSFTQGGLLPYTPPYAAGVGGLYRHRRWRLLYQAQYVSWRSSSLAPSRYTLLQPYLLHSASFSYIRSKWALELGIENATDATYQVIQGYPMPIRLFYLSWTAQL